MLGNVFLALFCTVAAFALIGGLARLLAGKEHGFFAGLGCMLFFGLICGPLGVWKLAELLYWLFTHLTVTL